MAGQYGATRMGYEAQLFLGTAGSTPTAQMTNCIDLDYNMDPDMGDTSTRGDGTSVPVATEKVTGLKPEITFKALNRPADTILVAMLAAAFSGAAMAARTKSYSSGKGYDGDVNVKVKQGTPLKGEATWEFTLTANDQLRDPTVWV